MPINHHFTLLSLRNFFLLLPFILCEKISCHPKQLWNCLHSWFYSFYIYRSNVFWCNLFLSKCILHRKDMLEFVNPNEFLWYLYALEMLSDKNDVQSVMFSSLNWRWQYYLSRYLYSHFEEFCIYFLKDHLTWIIKYIIQCIFVTKVNDFRWKAFRCKFKT